MKPNVNALYLCAACVILVLAGCTLRGLAVGGMDQAGTAAQGVPFLRKPSPRHIRVMSYNIGWDSIFPDDDPQNDRLRSDSRGDEFVRVVKAIRPDVICLQEINPDRDPQHTADILDSALPLQNHRAWQAHSGGDAVVVTRFDLSLPSGGLPRGDRIASFRHVTVLVDLPDREYEQDLYLVCAHFKSMGGEANIQARQEHADAIVEWIADARTPGDRTDLPRYTPIVVLGDLNVYDTDPAQHLTTLLTGDIVNESEYGQDAPPDWDGSGLIDALPGHNGADEEYYTWRDDTQAFNPGALDRILYTDSVTAVDNAFVLNTNAMSQEELDLAGLEPADVIQDPETGRYDHLPLVVDIRLREAPILQ
jgi:endonuclease/exonuclease/phosphatase family metal-dependent hydrolase